MDTIYKMPITGEQINDLRVILENLNNLVEGEIETRLIEYCLTILETQE